MGDSWRDTQAEVERLQGAEREARLQAGSEQRLKIEELAAGLDEEMREVRAAMPQVTGMIEDVMVHRFGGEIIRRPKQAEAYMQLGAKINEAVPTRGKVPVVLVYATRWDDSEVDYTSVFAAVDHKQPFYSNCKMEPDQLMHLFTGERENVTHVEMGLKGKTIFVGGQLFRLGVPANTRQTTEERLALSMSNTAANGRGRGMGGTYAFSDSAFERLPEAGDNWEDSEGERILVGWEDIEIAVLETRDVTRRIEIAKLLYTMAENSGSHWPTKKNSRFLYQVFGLIAQEKRAQALLKATMADPCPLK